MAQIVLDTVNFSTVPVTYTAGHNLNTDDANWSNGSSSFNPEQVSTPNGGANGVGGGARTGFTWTGDQFAQLTMNVKPDHQCGILLRFDASNTSGYAAGYSVDWGDGVHYYIGKIVTGALTALSSPSAITPTAGDILNLQVVGSNLTLSVNGSTILTYNDGLNLFTTNNPGFLARHDASFTAQIVTSWTAGSVGTVATGSPMFRGT